MKKKTEYRTRIEDQGDALLAMVHDRKARSATKASRRGSAGVGGSVWLVKFDSRERGNDVFRKLERDVDAVLVNAVAGDEVHLSIFSPGGAVTAYGNAAVQVTRLRTAGLKVTAFVDEIAASGGYMIACVCNEVVANPLAFVGSIGVVAQMPIAQEALERLGIRVEMFTAGERKRTVVPWKVPDEADRKEFEAKVTDIHDAFKEHVRSHRPNVTDAVMDGDYFMAHRHVGTLVDRIGDGHSAMLDAYRSGRRIYRVQSEVRKNFTLKRLIGLDTALDGFLDRLVSRLLEARFTGIG